MANLFPLVRPVGTGQTINLAETDVLLLGNMDRATAGNLQIGTATATTVTLGHAAAALDIDGSTVDIDAAAGFSIDGATASNVTVSGAAADLTLGARAGTVTLNEAGQTTLSGGFTATSIIGALNELLAGVGVSTDLDEAYNNFGANPAIVTIDNAQGQGDLRWNLSGAFSFIVNLASATGTADGFSIVDGTDQFDLIHKGANLIDLDADLQVVEIDALSNISLDAATASNFTVSGAAADLTLGARAGTVTLNEAGDTTLSGFTATSIIGALNELNAAVAAVDLDDAYNNFGAVPATIIVDNAEGQGDVVWDLSGAFSFNIDLSNTTGSADGFRVYHGEAVEYWRLIRKAANVIDLESAIRSIDYDLSSDFDFSAVTASALVVTGATADLTLGARGATITLNEVGQTTLNGAFTATSLIGALNELVSGPGITTDLNDAYDNFGANPATIIVDNAEGQGDVTWDLDGAFSFNIDLANTTGTNTDGFMVYDGVSTEYFKLLRQADNSIDLMASLNEILIAHSGDANILLIGGTDFSIDMSSVTGTVNGFGIYDGTDQFELIHKGANLVDLNADLQQVDINASSGILLDAATASNFTVSGATADLTLGARAATITLNESGDTTLSGFTATSIIGALNELNTGLGNVTLDQAYNNEGGAAAVTVDAGDVSWSLTGAFSFNVDLSGATGTADGFQVLDGTDHFKILHQGANSANLDADLNDITIDAAAGISLDANANSNFSTVDSNLTLAAVTSGNVIVNAAGTLDMDGANVTIDASSAVTVNAATASNFTVSGATADLTLGARAATVTLNESGDTTLSGFTATSIIGALNELNAAMAVCDLDCGYDNFGANPATIIVDNAQGQGDVTWDLTGAFSFIADLANVTGTADGFSVVDGTDQFDLIHKGANLMDLDADLQTVEIDASGGISLDAATASNFIVSGATADLTLGARAATITLNEAGETTLGTTFSSTSIIGALNELRDEETFVYSAGRATVVTNQYMRGPDRVPMNLAGYVVPWDATITGIGVATTGAQSWTAEVRKNDAAAVIASLVVVASARASTGVLSVNVNAGDELQFYCNGTNIITPMMTVYLRRR